MTKLVPAKDLAVIDGRDPRKMLWVDTPLDLLQRIGVTFVSVEEQLHKEKDDGESCSVSYELTRILGISS